MKKTNLILINVCILLFCSPLIANITSQPINKSTQSKTNSTKTSITEIRGKIIFLDYTDESNIAKLVDSSINSQNYYFPPNLSQDVQPSTTPGMQFYIQVPKHKTDLGYVEYKPINSNSTCRFNFRINSDDNSVFVSTRLTGLDKTLSCVAYSYPWKDQPYIIITKED